MDEDTPVTLSNHIYGYIDHRRPSGLDDTDARTTAALNNPPMSQKQLLDARATFSPESR